MGQRVGYYDCETRPIPSPLIVCIEKPREHTSSYSNLGESSYLGYKRMEHCNRIQRKPIRRAAIPKGEYLSSGVKTAGWYGRWFPNRAIKCTCSPTFASRVLGLKDGSAIYTGWFPGRSRYTILSAHEHELKINSQKSS